MYRPRSLQIFLVLLVLCCFALIILYYSPFRVVLRQTVEDSLLRSPNTINSQQRPINSQQGMINSQQETINSQQGTGDNKYEFLGNLSLYVSRNARGWTSLDCDQSRKLRQVSLQTGIGKFTFYIYDSLNSDVSVTRLALQGTFFEKKEIDRFIKVSAPLPLIDVGANVGLVALQAAQQCRPVVAVEPIPENALRLCRSALDFGRSHLMRVIGNAVSSTEGNVTLAMDEEKANTHFEVQRSQGWGHGAMVQWAILLDRVLEVVRFKQAAIKIDVESHEGHVIAGAEKLFSTVDVRMVWMEWAHVKKKKEFGAKLIMEFMRRHDLYPYDLMSNKRLDDSAYMLWPFTVLWKKSDISKPAG